MPGKVPPVKCHFISYFSVLNSFSHSKYGKIIVAQGTMACQEGCEVVHLIRRQLVLAGVHHHAKQQCVGRGEKLFGCSLLTQFHRLASEVTPSVGQPWVLGSGCYRTVRTPDVQENCKCYISVSSNKIAQLVESKLYLIYYLYSFLSLVTFGYVI